MKIYEKPFIKRAFNPDRENRYQIKKVNQKEENNQTHSHLDQENTTNIKEFKTNKDNKSKQLSVNKEYNNNKGYYIDEPSNKIKTSKHSSSTSKNFVYNFKNIDKPIVFKKPNNIKDNKANNYFQKNQKKNINEKLKNVILKISHKQKVKKYYNKWTKLAHSKKEKKKYNDYEDLEEDELEEVEDDKEIKDDNYDDSLNLEEIKERAPEEEESTIAIGLRNKIRKEFLPVKNKIILTNILRYRNPLKLFFSKWSKIIYDSISSKESNISINKNSNKYINKKEYIIQNNLKNFIEFGKTRTEVLKKYYDIWQTITFELESFNSKIKNEKDEYEYSYYNNNKKIKKEEKYNDNKKFKKQTPKKANFKLINNFDKNNQINNNDRDIHDKKKLKGLKILRKIIEDINDYKDLAFVMNKWYIESKNINKEHIKNLKKHRNKSKEINNINRYNIDDNSVDKQNTLTQSSYLNPNNNYLTPKDEISYSENSQRILSNSINMIDTKMKSKKNKNETERDKIKYRNNKQNNKEIKFNSVNELNPNRNNNNIRNASLESSPKNSDLINGMTPIENINDNYNKIYEPKVSNKMNNYYDKKSLKEKIKKIKKNHKNCKNQRYLLIKFPNLKRKKLEEFIDMNSSRESFTAINIKLKMENKQKILFKLFAKAYCRKNNMMNCFDKWFEATFHDKNYIPFMNEESLLETDNKSSSKNSKKKHIKSKSKNEKKTKKSKKKINDKEDKYTEESNPLYKSNNEAKTSDINSMNNNTDMNDNIESNVFSSINKSPDSKSKVKLKNKSNEKKNDSSTKKSKDNNETNLESLNSNILDIGDVSLDTKEEFNKSLENKNKKSDFDLNLDELNNIINNNKKSTSSLNKIKKYKNHTNRNNKNIINLEGNNIQNNNIININNNIINISEKSIGDNYPKKTNKEVIINNLKYTDQDDLNPGLLDLDFINKEEDVDNHKKHKKHNKKDDVNNEDMSNSADKKYSKKERILIKKYKKAFHKLRVVIRAFKKRKKAQNTFNPELEIKKEFQSWILKAFPDGLEQYRNQKKIEEDNTKKIKKKKRSKTDIKEKKNKKIKEYN